MVEKESDINEIINSAVEEGIEAITKRHPRFRGNREYIIRHIDKKRLKNKINEIYSNIENRNWTVNKKIEYLQKELTDYVETGAALDEVGKEVILKREVLKKEQEAVIGEENLQEGI
jgi:hypothetical protein